MRGYDCLLVCDPADDPGDEAAVLYAESVLAETARLRRITTAEFSALQSGPAAEMATLVVPVHAATVRPAIEAAVLRLRDCGAHIGVMALTADSQAAASVDLRGVFDTVISRDWLCAPDLLRRFVQGHRLRVQNRAFRAFLDHSVDGYWIWNVARDHLEWSDRTRRMTGTPPEAVPKTIADFIALVHPHDLDRVEQAIRNHLEHGAPYENIEMRLRLGGGDYGTFLANGQALRDENRRAIMLVGSLTDRSVMERMTRQLEDTQKRFTVLFHQMNDAAVLADIETGLILEANQPAERLWGKSVAELIGTHQTALHPPILSDEARKAFSDHIAALMRNKRDSISVPILRADGTEVPTEISSSLIEIDGRTCILGVFRDIRERVKAERDLRERDAQIQLSSHLASMGTLAAGVAHEINNPLTYVTGNLDLLKDLLSEKGVDDPDLTEAIDAAITGGRYVREIVSDLKTISRMDGGDEQCDVAEVLRIASRMAMSDLRHTARLEMDLGELPAVPISSARLSQVVLNLLSNANRAFSRPDRQRNEIRISARPVDGSVQIVIRDNGVGIQPDDLRRVWEPFFTRQSDKGGTGLGLSISRRILHEVGGTLDIESQPGEGTTVTILLPVKGAAPDAVAATAREGAASTSRRLRLLVVDDDVLVSNVIERRLRRDFDVTVHNSAVTALAAIRDGQVFDVVLCDIMMPEMDGPTFYAQAGGIVPFLFLTGGAVAQWGIDFERRMLAEGRVVYKPFDTAELRARLFALAARDAPATDTPAPVPAPAPDRKAAPATAEVDEAVLAELRDAMGPALVHRQLVALWQQVDALQAEGAGLSSADMMARAHRIGGAANVMGMRGLGAALYALEDMARAADPAQMAEGLARLDAQRRALAGWIDRLATG